MRRILIVAAAFVGLATSALAHDTWVQTNTNVVRVGDGVHIDLMLGNHGNEHRDFKLAGKVALEQCTLEVIGPDGKKYDIKERAIDTGYEPKDGFWSAKFITGTAGLHTVSHTVDSLFRTKRSIKSAKTYFVASPSLDKVSRLNPGFEKPQGHALEFIPETNPVTPMGPETPIKVRLLYKGKPLPAARVTFVARGENLSSEFDSHFERKTDAEGRATFTPTSGNYYLVVAHVIEPDEKGKSYDLTSYSATLTVFVPDLCPCCD